VMLALVPAALGLALGAGQGSTVAKALLSSSRLPAQLAGLVVGLSLPILAAFLGVLNQLLASTFGTLACLSVLAMVAVWAPLGALGSVRRSLVGSRKLQPGRAKLPHPIVDPAPASAVARAIGRRKYAVSGWLLLALVFVALYLGLSTAYSIVVEQLAEVQQTVESAASRAARGVNSLPLISLIITGVATLTSVVAKTYIAQCFYADAAVTTIVTTWHAERADSPETAQKRTDELAEVAAALEWAESDRLVAEKPKSDQTRARERGKDAPVTDELTKAMTATV